MTAQRLTQFLQHSPLFVLFGVAAAGFLIGKISVLGFSLGIAAVLFSGLFVGAMVPGLELPQFVPELGLVLFVYTLGLASGPSFFASLRLRGLRDSALSMGVLAVAALATALFARCIGLGGPEAAGVFAGALTSTPALAGVADFLRRSEAPASVLAAPVIAYSICYPMGVLVPMLSVWLAHRVLGKHPTDPSALESYAVLGGEPIVNATVRVEHVEQRSAEQLRKTPAWSVVFGRIRHHEVTTIVHDDTLLSKGDLVTVIGTERDVAAAASALGRVSEARIDLDRTVIDYRRMFVSNPAMTARPLRELHLIQKYDGVITRVRRGDVDLVPTRDFTLQLGDRVRVLAAVERMPEIQKAFGDSLKSVAEIDVISFSLGIALGLLLGSVPIPMPGGSSFELGLAGGPLVAGLVLGRLGRSGPLVWLSPFGANLTLRQFGLVLFLAGIGLRAGGPFASALATGEVLSPFLSGALVTLISTSLALVIGHRWLHIPLPVLTGTVSGIHTQPAVLAFAVDKAQSELPNVGYTAVFPLSSIAKIILAQILVHFI